MMTSTSRWSLDGVAVVHGDMEARMAVSDINKVSSRLARCQSEQVSYQKALPRNASWWRSSFRWDNRTQCWWWNAIYAGPTAKPGGAASRAKCNGRSTAAARSAPESPNGNDRHASWTTSQWNDGSRAWLTFKFKWAVAFNGQTTNGMPHTLCNSNSNGGTWVAYSQFQISNLEPKLTTWANKERCNSGMEPQITDLTCSPYKCRCLLAYVYEYSMDL